MISHIYVAHPSTLADANESRDWRIYADFAQVLIGMARPLYAHDPIGVDLDQTLYALDSTTIDLCLSLFPWARFRQHKAAVKMHTLLDLHGNIPTFIRITGGKVHDVNILDEFLPEAGAFYVMDRGYVDFRRLFVFTLCSAFFVVRTKKNVLLQRRYSHPVDRSTGLRSDHTVILTSFNSAQAYPDSLRRVSYFDAETNKRLKFLTNNFTLPALTIAAKRVLLLGLSRVAACPSEEINSSTKCAIFSSEATSPLLRDGRLCDCAARVATRKQTT